MLGGVEERGHMREGTRPWLPSGLVSEVLGAGGLAAPELSARGSLVVLPN